MRDWKSKDVFISYSRQERTRVVDIYEALQHLGLTVWFDAELEPGRPFDEEITREVRSARAVLVCWSRGSVASRWVRSEATLGAQGDRLIAVYLEPCDLPPPFNIDQTEDLSDWVGQPDHLGWGKVLRRLSELTGRTLRGASAHSAATRSGAPSEIVTENGGVELVLIPGGGFTMGSPPSEEGRYGDEGPPHRVTVPTFHLGRYQVTNDEYARFLAAHPDLPEPEYWKDRRFNCARQPVVGIGWAEARRFATWTGGRLPTEAEWEYAARAGTSAPYLTGANETDMAPHGWYRSNSNGTSHPVGQKVANAWGLHDVLGNVWEWVEDTWHDDYSGAPTDGSAWVDGDGTARVVRGGSWYSGPDRAHVASRNRAVPTERSKLVGLRVARCLAPGG